MLVLASRFRMKIALVAFAAVSGLLFAIPAAPLIVGNELLKTDDLSLTSYLAGATPVQDVRPQVLQRGVGLDGTSRAPSGMSINASPFEPGFTGAATQNSISLATGSYAPTIVDLAFPAPGFSWVIGRSYSAVQRSGTSSHVSAGHQGNNWFQVSQPELVLAAGTTDKDDILYIVYGADRFVEFRRRETGSTAFHATNGAAGTIIETIATGSGDADLYVLTDQVGVEHTFFGFDTDAGAAAGQLWKMNLNQQAEAYVGAQTAPLAISQGYDASGRILLAFDSAGRKYSYSYSTSGMLTEVLCETHESTWFTTAKVEYEYYGVSEPHGELNDLKLTKITTPQSDAGVNVVQQWYYRYYKNGESGGDSSLIKLILAPEGARRFDLDEQGAGEPVFDNGFESALTDDLKPYAAAFFTYQSTGEVSTAWFDGRCGCDGEANGLNTYSYESNPHYSDTAGAYDTAWKTRTIVESPESSAGAGDEQFLTQYFDEAGQALHHVITDGDPAGTTDAWVTKIVRDSMGLVVEVNTPANVTGYTHSTAGAGMSITTSSTEGLVWDLDRVASGDLKGLPEHRSFKKGTGASQRVSSTAYSTTQSTVAMGSVVIRPLLSEVRSYPTDVVSAYNSTKFAHTADSSYPLTVVQTVTTLPEVSVGANGSGSSDSFKAHFNLLGEPDFSSAQDGVITYHAYEDGQLTTKILDADTTQTGTGEDFENVIIPAGYQSPSGSNPQHRRTLQEYDIQGRPTLKTQPTGGQLTSHYARLSETQDGRPVVLNYTKYDPVSGTYFGPIGYRVSNHSGRSEVTASVGVDAAGSNLTISAHVDETESDPLAAVDSNLGTIGSLSSVHYNRSGAELGEQRTYFTLPATAWPGAASDYDAKLIKYDDFGRPIRLQDASGSVLRREYDEIGRVSSLSIGTNDFGEYRGSSSGTNNMTTVKELAYDGGNAGGNSHVTSSKTFVENSTQGLRETSFSLDERGLLLTTDNGIGPYPMNKYDNLGRLVASGLYSNIHIAGSDPTAVLSGRLSLHENFFDEMGRAYKQLKHEVKQSDGTLLDDLESRSWFDSRGRLAKVHGQSLRKFDYDSLGRITHAFELATDDDSSYADTLDVTGDIVIEQSQRAYDPVLGVTILEAQLSRLHSDVGSGQWKGSLDTNADGDDLKLTANDLKGRAQITGLWYEDYILRLTDSVELGTNSGATYDRSGQATPPATSDTELRSTLAYDDDNRVSITTDPMGRKTTFEYDLAGRRTKVVNNQSGSSVPTAPDDNVTTLYTYLDGLLESMTSDLPSGSTDQVTSYTYGTTRGTAAGDSKIATGHLMSKIEYPDSTGSSDSESFAYNALGELIYAKDQAGNEIERDYDERGLLEHVRLETVASGFDTRVRRQSWQYDALGRATSVTQHANVNPAVPSFLDEVELSYSDWGLISKFTQDHDSEAGQSGTLPEFDVVYGWGKSDGLVGGVGTHNRETLRFNSFKYPSGTTVGPEYSARSGSLDDALSRPTTLHHNKVPLVSYKYLGANFEVSKEYLEPGLKSNLFASGGAYKLDQFNRPTVDRWRRPTAPAFYKVELEYDRNSMITSVDDTVLVGHDVAFDRDALNRITAATFGDLSGTPLQIPTGSKAIEASWDLDHSGNWSNKTCDLVAQFNWNGAVDIDEDRDHNEANELLGRDTDANGTNDVTLVHDEVGNVSNDGQYKYTFDPLGRMTKVTFQSGVLVAEHRYNGLGYRVSSHLDRDGNGSTTVTDAWEHYVYDADWRKIATYLGDTPILYEEFVYDQSGMNGRARASVDNVAFRDRDVSSSGSPLSERHYLCSNRRGDTVAVVTDQGQLLERTKYTSYGEPFSIPAGDLDCDGDPTLVGGTALGGGLTDEAQFDAWIASSTYDVRGDLDLDGDVDATDKGFLVATHSAWNGGLGVLSNTGNLIGYAGYRLDRTLAGTKWEARNRVFDSELGRWLSRDPVRYADGSNMYQYGRSAPFDFVDPFGLTAQGDPSGSQVEDTPWSTSADQNYTEPEPGGFYSIIVALSSGIARASDMTVAMVQDAILHLTTEPAVQFYDPFDGAVYYPIGTPNLDAASAKWSYIMESTVQMHGWVDSSTISSFYLWSLAGEIGIGSAFGSATSSVTTSLVRQLPMRMTRTAFPGIRAVASRSTYTLSGTATSVDDKLTRYLLNSSHPVGGTKATWFQQALGFTRSNSTDLAKQIVFDSSRAFVTAVTQHGTKFNQIITIKGANGKVIDVVFAWIRNKDGIMRLVTANPTKL